MIRDSIKRLNTVVKELLLGILIFGAAIWMIFIWFISDKWGFSQGLLLGVAASALLAIHMNYSIEQSLERTETNVRASDGNGAGSFWRGISAASGEPDSCICRVVHIEVWGIFPACTAQADS